MIQLLQISWRNFLRNRGRYRLLLSALVLAVILLVVILGTVLGMTSTVRQKASRYFGGDLVILGYGQFGNFSTILDLAQLKQAIDQSGLEPLGLLPRSIYYRSDSTLFFNGINQPQRRLIGVHWEKEFPLLSSFDLASGTIPDGSSPEDSQAILISQFTARRLGVRVGDQVILSGTTASGQRNTLVLLVRGIFTDPSFFGFASYLPFEAVNQLQNIDSSWTSELGIYFGSGTPSRATMVELQQAFATSGIPSLGTFLSQDQRDLARRALGRNAEHHYGIMTLEANLAEIRDVIQALTLTAGFLVGLFLFIVGIGVANTYRMIVFERTKEIGTMRALGMTRFRIGLLFLFEAGFLGLGASILGGTLGILVLQILSQIQLPALEALVLFLQNGKLQWQLSLPWLGFLALVIIFASLGGSVLSAYRAAYLSPVDALRQE